jgi:hypothetical protein
MTADQVLTTEILYETGTLVVAGFSIVTICDPEFQH